MESRGSRIDVIAEAAPVQNAELNLAVAANHATVAVYANNSGGFMSLYVLKHFSFNIRYQFLILYAVGDDAVNVANADVTAAVIDGAMDVGEKAGIPLHRFDLANTADAHATVESGGVGKVLIEVAHGAPALEAPVAYEHWREGVFVFSLSVELRVKHALPVPETVREEYDEE